MDKFLDDVFPKYGIPGLTLPAKAPESPKPFYVIKRASKNWYAPKNNTQSGPWVETPAESHKYATARDAFLAFSMVERLNGGPVFIVRVTEVPGKTETRIVNKTKIDATKPVVLFNPRSGNYQKKNNTGGVVYADSLQDATVFSDLSDAIAAFHAEGAQAGRTATIPAIVHVHQVERITTPSTFTETEVK